MDSISGIILGVVQGITEFLPVSSSGHLILMRAFLEAEDSTSLAFDAVLQLATALAVVVYFWNEIQVLIQTVLRKLSRLPVNPRNFALVQGLLIGTIPAVIVGIFLEPLMETLFRSPLLVAGVLVAGSVFFMFAEYRYQNSFHTTEVDARTGLKVGLFQILALVPGFSRSGATIAGGMLLGMHRSEAARFSFLLAIPIILGSGGKKLIELMLSDGSVAWTPLVAGAVMAFGVGILAIHFMISFVRKHTLMPFAWYRIILACFVVFVTVFG